MATLPLISVAATSGSGVLSLEKGGSAKHALVLIRFFA